MNLNDKSKEELINDLQLLQQSYDSLKHILNNDYHKNKQVEQALRESEERYQMLFDKAPLGYQSLDFDGYFIEVNQQWLDTLGYQREEVIGKWFGDFLTPAYQEGFRQRFPVFKAQGHIHSEFEMIHKNGSILFIAFEGKIGYDLNGEFKQTHCILQDITEKKRYEIAFKESEMRFKVLFDDAPDAMLLADPESGKIVDANNNACRLFKKQKHELIGLLQYELHPPQNETYSKNTFKEHFENSRQIENNEPVENKICCSDGSEIAVEILGQAIHLDGKSLMLGTFRDISERKKAEQKLMALEQQSHTWLENSPLCTKIIDLDFNLQFMSSAGIRGLKIDDIKPYYGKPYPFHFYPESFKTKMTGNMNKAIETGEVITQEAPVVDINGNEIWYHSTIVPAKDENGRIEYLIIVSLETTERKLAEEALAQSRSELKAIYDLSPVMMCLVDTNRQVIFANHAFTALTGTDEERLKGGSACGVFGCINALDDSRGCGFGDNCRNCNLRMAMDDTLKNGTGHINVEYHTTLLQNGECREVVLLGSTALIESNNHRNLLLCLSDITERKQAEESLRKSESNYRQLFETLSEGVALNEIIYNDQGDMVDYRVVEVNPAFYITARYDGPVVGRLATEMYQMPVEYITAFWREHKERQTVQFTEMISPVNGRNVLVATSPFLNDRFVTSFFDITERKQAEEKLKKSEERYALVIEASEQGIWDWNVETNEVFYSEQWKKQIGYQDHELKNDFSTWVEHLHPDEKEYCQQAVYSYLSNPVEHFILDFRFLHKDGTYRWIHNKAAYIKNTEGKVIRMFGAHTDITESKLNEAIFKDIIEKNPMSIQILDMEGYPIQENTAHTRLFGAKVPSEYSILKDTQLLALGFDEFFERIKKGEVVYFPDANYNVHDIDPSFPDYPVWVSALGFTLNDNNGKPEKIVLMHENITERKNAESSLNDIIEKNPMSIQILDMEGYPIKVNSAHTKLFGVEPPTGYSVLKDNQLLALGFDEYFNRIKKGEVVYFPDSYYNVHDVDPSFPDSPVWVKALGFTLNDNNGKPEKIVLMHENITERKNAETLLNDIIENNPMSIQIVDKEGYTLRGNPAFIQLFGSVPPPEFSIFEDLKTKNPEMENIISRLMDGEIVHLPDIYFNAHDTVAEAPDIPLWIRALIFPLKDSGGKPERFVFMHENITESKIAEQELIKAKEKAQESDRLKSAFLANMSHEIRTPMNGILGFADLLKEPGLTGEEQQKYIGIIGKSGARMLNIINDIIDISKIEAGLMKLDIKETNINEQIEYIYTFFKPEVEAKGMNLFFNTKLPQNKALITTDREKLYAIFTNLVKNAIKYSKEGSIELGYNTFEKDDNQSVLEFYVKDSGIGIPKDRQHAIFERFVQADIEDEMARQGAGLGLAITKSYIEMLGGKIWVESEEGIGSCFYFTLPYIVNNEETAIISDDSSDSITTTKNLKILIAEDDETSETLLSILLVTYSKDILKVKNGIDAIEICRQNPDIDLIMMDIRMPLLGGYEATKQIREFNKEVIIIAQTAYGLSGDKEKAIEAGCDDYISKPIKKHELLALIQKYFNK